MTGFVKREKFCQLLWLLFTIANRQQFFYIWYQRLFEFLEDAGRRSNTIAPRTWLRYTDNDKVKGSFYKKKKLEACEGGHMGGLFDQTGSFDAHSVASHFWANWFHWCQPVILKKWSLTTIYKHLTAENCSGFSHGDVRAKSYDLDCRQKHSVVCQVLRYILNAILAWNETYFRILCPSFGWEGSVHHRS